MPPVPLADDEIGRRLSSHDAGGITARDFRLAQRIDS